ncbi:MAG: winged helix-turn-helix transcriptional regulator [Thermoplasmata archaeon]
MDRTLRALAALMVLLALMAQVSPAEAPSGAAGPMKEETRARDKGPGPETENRSGETGAAAPPESAGFEERGGADCGAGGGGGEAHGSARGSEASCATEGGDGQRDVGGTSPRSIVVVSENVSITLAKGTFESGLQPFPDLETGLGRIYVDEPLDLTGQLVDGNFTLLSYGGGREAALRNKGVAGHGETIRWWFNGEEQCPIRVSWCDPAAPGGEINGTFFIRGWVPERRLAPSAGIYEMKFSFAGTRAFFPGVGELQLYPPAELLVRVEVLFPTVIRILEPTGAVDAGSTCRISGRAEAVDGGPLTGVVRTTLDGATLGPPLPAGLYIDELELTAPGIPAVLFREGFEAGAPGWSFGGDGVDWEAGRPSHGPAPFRGHSCLGTNLDGPYSHLADEWAESPLMGLNALGSETRISFAFWKGLAPGDRAGLRVWNGSAWSDPVAIVGPEGEWIVMTVELASLRATGSPMDFSSADGVVVRFELKSTTPSARLSNGAFSLDWDVPLDAPAGHVHLDIKFIPDGPYYSSFAHLRIRVRGATRFEIPEGEIIASPGGWAEVRARLVDARGIAPVIPAGTWGSGLINVLWDNGSGAPVEVRSVTAPNVTGFFAAAIRIPYGERPGNAAFRLLFEGTESYQPAEAEVGCRVVVRPRFELPQISPVRPGSEALVSGALLLDGTPLPGESVWAVLPFDPWGLAAETDSLGRFSIAFFVPETFEEEGFELVLRSNGSGHGLLPGEGRLDVRIERSLSVIFEGGEWAKGHAVETWLDGLRFPGVAGKVVDEAGEPLSGASVMIEALRAGYRELLGRVRTDPLGYFCLPHTVGWSEPAGELRVVATASLSGAGTARREAVFRVTVGTLIKLDPLPTLTSGGPLTVSGVLRENWGGESGDPVGCAPVTVVFGGRSYSCVTDPSGRFCVSAIVLEAEGAHELSVLFSPQGAMASFLSPSSTSIKVDVRAPPPASTSPGSPAPAAAPSESLGRTAVAVSAVSAVLAAVAIVGAEASRYKLLLALVPLYSKIKKEEVLDQFVRGQVFGYIQANPGDHYSSIRRTLRLKNGTLAYHLRTLEREGFIFSRMDRIYRRFYPTGVDPARVRLRLGVRETQKKILELIQQRPGITPNELANALETSHQVVSYHIRLLARRGSVKIEQRGRNTLCYPSEFPAVTGSR